MGQRLLITGTSQGLGYALSLHAHSEGWFVDALGRHKPGGSLASAERLRFHACDLSLPEQIADSLAPFLAEAYDLVILNAGVLGEIRDMQETPLVEIERVMRINTWSNKCLLDALIAHRIKVRQIVAISSGASVSGTRGWNAYALSKAALNMLVQLYAAEMPETHLCALAPGLVDTGMQDQVAQAASDPRFPKMAQLRDARGTQAMPVPEVLAPVLMAACEQVLERYPSGAFVDIRKMEPAPLEALQR